MSLLDQVRGLRTFFVPPEKTKPKPPSLDNESAYADPSRLFPGGPSTPYNPSVLISRRGYSTIDEMRRDDQVKAALAFKKHAVIASGWSIVPPADMDKNHEQVLFLQDMLKGMRGSFNATLLEILTALDYGFSFSEKVWTERDGKIMLAEVKTRHPHELSFQQDVYGNVVGVKQINRDLTPLDKFILYTYEGEFSNPYGRTDLEAAYRPWWLKKNAYNWLAILLEKMGIPPIFALYDPASYKGADGAGRSKVNELRQVLESLQAATVGALPRPTPEALELWTPELAGQVATVFIPAFEMLNKDISRALLMPGLLGMTDDSNTGSLARSKVHFDVFMLVLERIRQELEETVVNEQIIKPALMYNFSDVSARTSPMFKLNPISDQLKAEIMTSWQGLVGAKVVTPSDEDEAHIRTLFDFPEYNEKSAKDRSDRQVKESAAATEANAKAQQAGAPQDPPASKSGFKSNEQKPTLSDAQFDQVLATLRYEWNEEDHPRYPEGHPKGGQFMPKDGGDTPMEGLTDQEQAVEALLQEAMNDPMTKSAQEENDKLGDARHHYSAVDENGKYTPEADAFNREVAMQFLNKASFPAAGEKPEAFFMVGRPGAGKSTTLKAEGIGGKHTVINADDIMEKLPGFKPILAPAYHEWGADIAEKYLVPMALEMKLNVLLDVTGKTPSKLERWANDLKDKGYNIRAAFKQVDTKTSLERAYNRFKNGGRFVPFDYIANAFKTDGPKQSYEMMKNKFDPQAKMYALLRSLYA